MDKVQRVLTALNGGIPDKVPYMYNTVMQNVQEALDCPNQTGKDTSRFGFLVHKLGQSCYNKSKSE